MTADFLQFYSKFPTDCKDQRQLLELARRLPFECRLFGIKQYENGKPVPEARLRQQFQQAQNMLNEVVKVKQITNIDSIKKAMKMTP